MLAGHRRKNKESIACMQLRRRRWLAGRKHRRKRLVMALQECATITDTNKICALMCSTGSTLLLGRLFQDSRLALAVGTNVSVKTERYLK
jgi:hypothetical protein